MRHLYSKKLLYYFEMELRGACKTTLPLLKQTLTEKGLRLKS